MESSNFFDKRKTEGTKPGLEITIQTDTLHPPTFFSPNIDSKVLSQLLELSDLRQHDSIEVVLSGTNSSDLDPFFKALKTAVQSGEADTDFKMSLVAIITYIHKNALPLGSVNFEDYRNPVIHLFIDNIIFMKYVAQVLLPSLIDPDTLKIIQKDLQEAINAVLIHEIDHINNDDSMKDPDTYLHFMISLFKSSQWKKYLEASPAEKRRMRNRYSSVEQRAWEKSHLPISADCITVSQDQLQIVNKLRKMTMIMMNAT